MRIAVTYEDGMVGQHFGHTEYFKVYDVEEGKIVKSEVVSSNGQGHGMLAFVLKDEQVDLLICGGIGMGARNALNAAGIDLIAGAAGDADKIVKAFLEDRLVLDSDGTCHHHDHEEGHQCHHDDCGDHICH